MSLLSPTTQSAIADTHEIPFITTTSHKRKTTIFNDCVHEHIELDEASVAIIDTPQFQRLRDIRQLGGVYYVFPTACHQRFEHCLGVAHLARTFIRMIAAGQPELGITEADCLCVEVAGLCHDLGHGIMSHMFDRKFIPKMCAGTTWEHEHASIAMLDYLLKENDLKTRLERAGLSIEFVDTEEEFASYKATAAKAGVTAVDFPDSDLHFIKELILGDPSEAPAGWVWRGVQGRTSPALLSKRFLFDIVANKTNSIDVDKLDYFSRDCKQLNVAIPFDASRLMRFARVVPTESGSAIAFAAKEAWNVYQLFASRYSLHKRAYQHRVARVVETMITEALILADPHILITGRDGKRLRISESIWDMCAYSKVSDYLLRSISSSSEPELAPARALLHRVARREFYNFIAETLWNSEAAADEEKSTSGAAPTSGHKRSRVEQLKSEEAWSTVKDGMPTRRRVIRERDALRIQKEIFSCIDLSCVDAKTPLTMEDLYVEVITINMGMGSKNPVDKVLFFHSDKTTHEVVVGNISPQQVSVFVPQIFEEQYVRLYCKVPAHAAALRAAFDAWCASTTTATPLPFSPSRAKRPRATAPPSPDAMMTSKKLF